MGTQAIEGLKRTDGWRADPRTLIIAGLDNDDRFPENPLVDDESNARDDGELESLVGSIMQQGVTGAVVGVKRGGGVTIVDGRSTTRAARIAGDRLEALGKPRPLVTVKLEVVDPKHEWVELFRIVEARNQHRREISPLAMARRAAIMQKQGADLHEIAITYGVTDQAVRNWCELNELAPPVRKAIERKEISANEGRKLHRLPEKDQRAALTEILERKASGEKVTGDTAARIARDKANRNGAPAAAPPAPRMGKREVMNQQHGAAVAYVDGIDKHVELTKRERDLLETAFRCGALWAVGDYTPGHKPPPPATIDTAPAKKRGAKAHDLDGFNTDDVPEA